MDEHNERDGGDEVLFIQNIDASGAIRWAFQKKKKKKKSVINCIYKCKNVRKHIHAYSLRCVHQPLQDRNLRVPMARELYHSNNTAKSNEKPAEWKREESPIISA